MIVQARIAKLRAHHELAAKALRTKIELRINRVPKRMWTKTLREVQTELRLGRPAPTVKGAGLARVHKQAPASATTAAAAQRLAGAAAAEKRSTTTMKKSPAKITLAKYAAPTAASAAFSALNSTTASAAVSHKTVAPLSPNKKPGMLSPVKPLYPTLPDMPHYMRSPSALSVREQVGPKAGSVRAQKAVTTTAPLTTAPLSATAAATTTTKQPRVVKKTASNSSLTSSTTTTTKPKQTTTTSTTATASVSRPGSAASTTGTGRRVGRPPKVKPVAEPASSDSAGEGGRRTVTRNLRSRG